MHALPLNHVAHVGGDDKGLVAHDGLGHLQLVGAGFGSCHGQAERAGSLPEAVAVLRRAGNAREHLVSREDALGELRQTLRKRRCNVVPVCQYVFDHAIVVDARQAAQDHGSLREVGGQSCTGGTVSRAKEHLLHGETTLLQDVVNLVQIVKARRVPDLGRQACQRVDLLSQSAGTNHEQRAHVVRVVVLVVNLHGEVEVAQIRLNDGVKLGCRKPLGVHPREQVSEDAHIGQVVVAQATKVEVVIGIDDAMGLELMGQAWQRRLTDEGRGLMRSLTDL